jgi:RNA polymerase sigma factor (sigma-70 family)
MPTRPQHGLLSRLRRTLYGDGGGRTDGQLLEAFVRGGEEAAFEALLRRHGPMVLGVCRRVLGNDADAEDAFQATFFVLFRKAAALRRTGPLGNWLYGVAHRTALGARSARVKRRAKEEARRTMAVPQPPAEDTWREVQAVLDQELSRLPEYYRVPIVLCDLEGKSRKDAAHQLGWPIGTVSGRLARGRVLLARRLARHGLAVSGGALAVALKTHATVACVPRPLHLATLEAVAAGVVPDRVAALARGVFQAMLLTKLKIATVCLLGLVALGLVVCRVLAGPASPAAGGAGPEPQGGAPARPAAQDGVKVVKIGNRVNSVAYCHDGRSLAVILWNGAPNLDTQTSSVVLWDLQKGKAEKTLEQFGEGRLQFRHLASSRDGTAVAASATEVGKVNYGAVRAWEARTGKLVGTFELGNQVDGAVALSADGKKVAGGTCITGNGELTVWDVASAKVLQRLEADRMEYFAAAFSEDGKWVAAGGRHGTGLDKTNKVVVWDVTTGKVKHEWHDPTMAGAVVAVAFSPDGKELAAGGVNDATVRVWDVKTGKVNHLLNAHEVQGLAYSPDGRTLATAGNDHKVILWDVGKENARATLQGHGHIVMGIAFAPDGRTLASGGLDATLRFWPVKK